MNRFLIEASNNTETLSIVVRADNWVKALESAADEYMWAFTFRVVKMNGLPFSDVIYI